MTTGYLTQQDLVNLKITVDAAEITSKQIDDLIKSDLNSDYKNRMREGSEYYDVEHDILDNKNYYYVNGIKTEDKAKSNYRLPHPFHKVLVDQKASYIAGNPIVISVTSPDVADDKSPTPAEESSLAAAEEFEQMVLDKVGEKFDDKLNDWIVGASKKGQEWMHFYVIPTGELRYTIIPAEEIIAVYDTQYQEDLVAVIRYYTYELVNEAGATLTLYKLEWWTKTQVEYWVQEESGLYVRDPAYNPNPGSHWKSFNSLTPTNKLSRSWGRVPFVSLYNNTGAKTDLEPIKPLVDAYDKVVSGWVNDLNDFQEMVYILKGYAPLTSELETGLSELALFMKNLKTHKVISVGEAGDVTTLKAEIPVEAKEKLLGLTRKAIFYFGQGVDVANEEFKTPSGIALKFLYGGLDLKANQLIRKLKASLAEFFWFVVGYANMRDGTQYDSTELSFTVNKSVIINEAEKVQELAASETMLSKQTILENHPLVDDAEEEMRRLDAEEAARAEKGIVDLSTVDVSEPANGDEDVP